MALFLPAMAPPVQFAIEHRNAAPSHLGRRLGQWLECVHASPWAPGWLLAASLNTPGWSRTPIAFPAKSSTCRFTYSAGVGFGVDRVRALSFGHLGQHRCWPALPRGFPAPGLTASRRAVALPITPSGRAADPPLTGGTPA